jgi:enamine deaminase RidA (YjgF/YER057c/UK114 family)
MSKIVRTDAGPILSKAVEYHGFIFTAGIIARDPSADITAQTKDVLAQADALLEEHGTDRTRLLQAQIWLKHMSDRDAMNAVWSAWLPEGLAPARACVQAEMAHPDLLVEIMLVSTK